MGLLQQPIHAIRAYFGSKIAFYFAWAETYTCWLLWTLLLMLPTEVARKAIEDPAVDAYLQVAYCVLMGAMATFLNEFWVNKRTALAHVWDVADIKTELRPRPEYLRSAHEGRWRLEEHGGSAKHGISKLHGFWAEGGIFVEDQNEGAQLVMSPKDRTQVNMIGTAILILLCTATVISTLAILTLQMLWALAHQFEGTVLRDNGGLIGSLIITAQVVIMNVLYKKLAVYLTDVENHRTEDAYEDALIIKVPSAPACQPEILPPPGCHAVPVLQQLLCTLLHRVCQGAGLLHFQCVRFKGPSWTSIRGHVRRRRNRIVLKVGQPTTLRAGRLHRRAGDLDAVAP
eukprot:6815986-Prymnesium_polylepis.1